MDKIFIYYSLSGNGDAVADYLKAQGISIRKVVSSGKMPKSMFFRILIGGFLAGINYKPKLVDFDTDISGYEEVIIGSPIWNGRLACPISAALDKLNLENKKITFILYSGSGEAPKVESYLKERYSNSKIIILKEPKRNIDNMKNMLDI